MPNKRKYFLKEFVCENCHIVFTRYDKRKYRFCSPKCRAAVINVSDPFLRSIFTCKWCGIKFKEWTYRHPVFCSLKCKSCYGASCPRPKARRPETAHIERICLECGKTYYTTKTQIEKRGSNYCSRKCMGNAQSKNMMGAKHPRWKGYPPSTRGQNWDKIKRYIKKRDSDTCQNCGRKHKKKEKNFDVHHIIPYRIYAGNYEESNVYYNLILLCRTCHQLIENNKIPCPFPKLL